MNLERYEDNGNNLKIFELNEKYLKVVKSIKTQYNKGETIPKT